MLHLFNQNEILGQINLIKKKFQQPVIGLDVCVIQFFKTQNKYRLGFDSVNQRKTKCEGIEIPVEKRFTRKRKLLEEKEADVCQTLE